MTAQLGFADLLTEAATTNEQRQMDRATAHLPGTMEEALPFYRRMIDKHNAAMQAADIEQAMSIREEAHQLAAKLNGGTCGIIAGPDAPGCILERESAAPPDSVPLWGQAGEFTITVGAMRVRIELKGMFGIGSTSCLFPGFYARAVDLDRPFFERNRIPLLPWPVRSACSRADHRGLLPRDDCRACQAGTERQVVADREAPERLTD
jgi:hypothetical protein